MGLNSQVVVGANSHNESDDFAETLCQEIQQDGFDCAAVDILIEMANTGELSTVGDVLASLVEQEQPDWAAELCRRIMTPSGSDKNFDYSTVAGVIGHLVELGMVEERYMEAAFEICKHLLIPKDLYGGPVYDCFDVSFIIGSMVELKRPEWAGQLCYYMYAGYGDTEDNKYQTLLLFVLGTLIDFCRPLWAYEICVQLLNPGEEYGGVDYSTLGWVLAQSVWFGRSDWAAAICDELLTRNIEWFKLKLLLDAVEVWGDSTYSQNILNFMKKRVVHPEPNAKDPVSSLPQVESIRVACQDPVDCK